MSNFCTETVLSTSPLHKGYVPYFMLPYYEVYFRGREMGVAGLDGVKVANAKDGFIITNGNRKLHGEVQIRSTPPF